MTVEQLRKLIRDAGRDPVERDTLYKELKTIKEASTV